jgi:hypothetical protein
MGKLLGKVVVITGGTQGIGLAPQNSSPVRVLMSLLLAVAKRNLNKPYRQSAATSPAFKATLRIWPTSIVSASASKRRAELMFSSPMPIRQRVRYVHAVEERKPDSDRPDKAIYANRRQRQRGDVRVLPRV